MNRIPPTIMDAPTNGAKLEKITPQVQLSAVMAAKSLTADERATLRRVLRDPIECYFHPAFRKAATEKLLMGPIPEARVRSRSAAAAPRSSDDSGAFEFTPMVRTATLTAEQERFLFLRFNYCRFRVKAVVKRFEGERLTVEAAREILTWSQRALETRNHIANANIPLVLAMARRTRVIGVDLADVISEGNMALLRAVDKFDCMRGFKFSTYGCRAILKSFARASGRAARDRGVFPVEYDPSLEKSDHTERVREDIADDYAAELRSILEQNLADLNDVERRVLAARFGMDERPETEPLEGIRTLAEVGNLIGVTKERVRQIQNRAVVKLRDVLECRMLGLPLPDDEQKEAAGSGDFELTR
ncbi:MAG: sigma-70 family RNA polymerase sigma factor [Planctomycetia bacterium]|nr:MAG: sigma-70 family RNA polymerase sigma factor [Planctomycetia bacterium]